jgi:uncharacterized protein (DUF433 family)
MSKLDRITIDPNVCLGQPTIRNLRIPVSTIFRILGSGHSHAEALAAYYPELTEADLQQALLSAAWLAADQLHVVRSA